MGTWGIGILQDDTVSDVVDSFEAHLKAGATFEEATTLIRQEFTPDDPDDAPLERLGLAYAQWKYGVLDPTLFDAVRRDIETEAGLATWKEGGAADLGRRQAALRTFLERISGPNPRPSRRPRLTVRPPKFLTGSCLAVTLSNGAYGAALVLASDHTDPEYGRNLIASLDYMAPAVPDIGVFRQRRWLRLTHHAWKGRLDLSWYLPVRFRSESHRFRVVGSMPIEPTDPQESQVFSGWHHLGQQVELEMTWRASAT